MAVAELADELVNLADIEGVTFSGGEPMAQATALARLIDLVRGRRDLSFLSYTGFTLKDLERRGTAAQKSLLQRLDMLIDGVYVAQRHTELQWRGSDNQQVHFLSPRYRQWADEVNRRGRWLEFEYNEDGLAWMGIPPLGFTQWLETHLLTQGVQLSMEDRP
jgi:anaerobic ribonucleoside-triphosphate reductase activating protein